MQAKKSILFVDDEHNVLDGLRRMLRTQRRNWEMGFVDNTETALATLAETPYQVVVADMGMPGRDGSELLAIVKERFPHIIRIALSAQTDKEEFLKSMGLIHQFLSKPCEADTLRSTLIRSFALRDLLSNELLMGLIPQLDSLPSLTTVYVDISAELRNPAPSVRKISEIVGRDIGMTAKIMKLINSAFFGLRRHISDLNQAVNLLGLDTVRSLALSVEIFSKFEQSAPGSLDLQSVWRHSVSVAELAKHIAQYEKAGLAMANDAYLAGLLHDVGKLVLAVNLSAEYGQVVNRADKEGIALNQAEREFFGTTHAEVGAYLMGLWGLPDTIIEAIAYHHSPAGSFSEGFSPLTAVHCADFLEKEGRAGKAGQFDEEYLQMAGVGQKLDAWRKQCLLMAEEAEA